MSGISFNPLIKCETYTEPDGTIVIKEIKSIDSIDLVLNLPE